MKPNRLTSVLSAIAVVVLFASAAACGGDDDDGAAETTSAPAATAAPAETTATTPAPDETAATETSATESTEAPATTAASAEDDIAALYEAAQEEGELYLFTTANEVQVQPTVDAFEAKYPGIEVNWERSSTPDMIQRFSAEFDSNVNAIDVMQLTDTVFIEDAISQSKLVPLADADLPGGFPGDLPEEWLIADGELGVQSMSPSGFAYNSGLVEESEAPTTWEDLLDPQWKGQIIMLDPATAGAAIYDFFDFLERTYGPEYLEGLAAQEPTWYDTAVPGAQAHAAGEKALFLPAFPSLTNQMIANGAPVVQVPQDTATGVLYVSIPAAKAPHPNAARLFVDFLYTEEGADIFSQIPDQVSPFGGGMGQAPPDFVQPDSVNAATDARKAEISALLGRGS